MDQLDRAQIYEEQQRRLSLQNRHCNRQPGLSESADCGGEIPAARQALAGVTRCIDCQSEHERRGELYV